MQACCAAQGSSASIAPDPSSAPSGTFGAASAAPMDKTIAKLLQDAQPRARANRIVPPSPFPHPVVWRNKKSRQVPGGWNKFHLWKSAGAISYRPDALDRILWVVMLGRHAATAFVQRYFTLRKGRRG